MFWGRTDKAVIPPGGTGTFSTIEQLGGHWAMYLDTDGITVGSDFDLSKPTTNRTAIDAYTSITDQGPAWLTGSFYPGGVIPGDGLVTVLQSFDFSALVGSGNAYADITGGTAASIFDTNSIMNVGDLAMNDMHFRFTTTVATAPLVAVGETPWFAKLTDPIEASVVVPEPTTVVLLGIGILGMVGVAARKRKLAKK